MRKTGRFGKHMMRSKAMAVVLSVTMVGGCLGAGGATLAFADTPDEDEYSIVSEEVSVVPEAEELADGDELFAEYVDKAFYGDYGIATLANYADQFLNETSLAFYHQIKEFVTDVADGNRSSTTDSFTWDSSEFTWTPEELGVSSENTDENLLALRNAATEVFMEAIDIQDIVSCLMVDCPYELYWYDKTLGYSYSISFSYRGTASAISSMTVTGVNIYFSVSSDYRYENYLYVTDTSKTSATQTAVSNAKAIVDYYDGLSDREKLIGYKDAVCYMTDYNNDAYENSSTPYGDPWQMIYVFDGDDSTKVVCEGYSKAFQYLCDMGLTDAVSYLVTGVMHFGTGDGAHMWNVVSLEGTNYLCDVTNSDSGTVGSDGSLFLVYSGSGNETYEDPGLEYDFYPGNGTHAVTYVYDDSTLALYPSSILTLGTAKTLNITAQPDDLSLTYGYTGATLSVVANMSDATYQWYERNADGTGTAISGATGSVYSVPTGMKAGESAAYYCVVSCEGYDPKTSDDAVVTVGQKTLTPSISGTAAKTYDGTTAVTSSLSISLSGIISGDIVTATASYAYASADAGTGITVTASDIVLGGADASNYVLSAARLTTAGTINAKTLTESMVSGIADSYYYTGQPIEPEVTVSDNGIITSSDYTISYADNTAVGIATVTVTGRGNYTGSVTKSFVIEYYEGNLVIKYNGSTEKAEWYGTDVVISADGYTVAEGTSSDFESEYTVSGEGTVTAQIRFTEAVTGFVTDVFTVNVNIDKTGPVFTAEGNGIEIKNSWYKSLLNTISFGRLFNDATIDVTIAASDAGVGMGTYYYYVDTSGSTTALTADQLDAAAFTEAANGKFSVSDEDGYVIYAYAVDALGNKSDYICSEGFVIDRTGPVISLTPADVEDEYADIYASVNEAETVYYVIKAAAQEGITAEDIINDDSVFTMSVSGASVLDLLFEGLEYNTTYYVYAVGIDLAGNTGEVEGYAFTTDREHPRIIEAPVLSGVYGTAVAAMDLTPGLAYCEGAVQEGSWVVTDAMGDDVPSVGTDTAYTVTFIPEDGGLSSVSTAVVPTVEKKDVTVLITDAERVFGTENPGFTYSVIGMVNGDGTSALGVTLGTDADSYSPVGTYEIYGTADSQNYEVTIVSGTLTITQAQAVISVDPVGKKHIGDDPFALVVNNPAGLELVYETSDPEVLTVDAEGLVTLTGIGSATVTVTAIGNINYYGAACEVIIEVAEVEKEALLEEVEDDEQIEDDDYTDDSWNDFEDALHHAEEVLDDPGATQDEVDEALEELVEAKEALKKSEDQAGTDTGDEDTGDKDTGNKDTGNKSTGDGSGKGTDEDNGGKGTDSVEETGDGTADEVSTEAAATGDGTPLAATAAACIAAAVLAAAAALRRRRVR